MFWSSCTKLSFIRKTDDNNKKKNPKKPVFVQSNWRCVDCSHTTWVKNQINLQLCLNTNDMWTKGNSFTQTFWIRWSDTSKTQSSSFLESCSSPSCSAVYWQSTNIRYLPNWSRFNMKVHCSFNFVSSL